MNLSKNTIFTTEDIRKELRELFDQSGKTWQQFADDLGIQRSNLQNYFNNSGGLRMTQQVAQKIANYFGLDIKVEQKLIPLEKRISEKV